MQAENAPRYLQYRDFYKLELYSQVQKIALKITDLNWKIPCELGTSQALASLIRYSRPIRRMSRVRVVLPVSGSDINKAFKIPWNDLALSTGPVMNVFRGGFGVHELTSMSKNAINYFPWK